MMLPTASGLDRAVACAPAYALPHVESTNADAAAGVARHLYLEAVGNGTPPEDALLKVAEEHRSMCAAIDLDRLPKNLAHEVAFAIDVRTGAARELGRGIRRQYEAHGAGAHDVCGTIDVLGLSADAVYVGDFKGPYAPIAPAATARQLHFGALAAARVYGRDRAIVEMIRIREDGSPWRDRAELDALDLDSFALVLDDLARRVHGARMDVLAGQVPSVREGEHCRYCPAFMACPAKTGLVKRMASGAEWEELELLKPMTPRTAGLAYVRIQEAERMLHRIKAACIATAQEHGRIELPDGKEMRWVVEPGNEKLDGRVLYQVAREEYGQAFADDAIEIHASKAALDRALARAAQQGVIPPRGRKKAAEEILAAVRERGGTSRPTVKHLVAVDPALPAEGEAA